VEVGLGVKQRMAARAAQEISDGMVVNLGIGLPTLVADHVPEGRRVTFQAENGMLGYGRTPERGHEDPNLINAGGLPVTEDAGASYFDSTIAFGMIRRGRLDLTVLGALQVGERGDLANWLVPGQRVPGMGGAMELAQKARKVIALTLHTAKDGSPKILPECTFPLTAREAVDLIITDLAVIEVTSDGLLLKEVAEGVSVEQVLSVTSARLAVDRNPGSF